MSTPAPTPRGYFLDWDGQLRSVDDPGAGWRCDVDTAARYVGCYNATRGTLDHEATLYRTLEAVAKAGIQATLVPGSSPGAARVRADAAAQTPLTPLMPLTPLTPMSAAVSPVTPRERYFLTYRGVRLPLQLTEELAPDALRHRNTWLRATYDEAGRLLRCEKVVYGSTELRHDYRYDADGRLCEAVITLGEDEPQVMRFDAA